MIVHSWNDRFSLKLTPIFRRHMELLFPHLNSDLRDFDVRYKLNAWKWFALIVPDKDSCRVVDRGYGKIVRTIIGRCCRWGRRPRCKTATTSAHVVDSHRIIFEIKIILRVNNYAANQAWLTWFISVNILLRNGEEINCSLVGIIWPIIIIRIILLSIDGTNSENQ